MGSSIQTITTATFLLVVIFKPSSSDRLEDLLNEQWNLVTTSYLRYEATTKFLEIMKESFPENLAYYSIGESVQGRKLYVARLGIDLHRPDIGEKPTLRPKMAIIGNIRGDETLGKQLVLMLMVDLLKRKKANDERAKRILETTDIHMLLTMNPDGYEMAIEGECSPDENIVGRLNANMTDLLTDFPHIWDETDLENMQLETKSVYNWENENQFLLSLTFFAGEIVATYPYSSLQPWEVENISDYMGKGIPSPTEDDDVFAYLATTYASNHKTMTNGNNCNSSAVFDNGIINGAKWSNTVGTWQDHSYYSYCMDIMVGLSCCKSVPATTFSDEWENNKESLYKYIEVIHMGVKGVVILDDKPARTLLTIKQNGHLKNYASTNKFGEYWKLLLPGDGYLISASRGEQEQSEKVAVKLESHDPPQAFILNLEIVRGLRN